MLKLVVGILKGAVIGGALGYGAFTLGNATGFDSPWVTYGLIGALVGLFVGRSLLSLIRDKNATAWVAILKGAFGFGIGCGLYALIAKAWSPAALYVSGYDIFTWPVTLGGAIGAVYGGFVELDDAIGEKDPPPARPADKPAAKPTTKPKG